MYEIMKFSSLYTGEARIQGGDKIQLLECVVFIFAPIQKCLSPGNFRAGRSLASKMVHCFAYCFF